MSHASAHLANRRFIQIDLKDFFPSITVDDVLGVFRSFGFGADVAANEIGTGFEVFEREFHDLHVHQKNSSFRRRPESCCHQIPACAGMTGAWSYPTSLS